MGGTDILEIPKGLDGRRRAGFGVCFATNEQGKGFARVIYEAVLEELQARGISVYVGSTGQPGVMRLGKILDRQLRGVEVDRGITRPFRRGHFRSWLSKSI